MRKVIGWDIGGVHAKYAKIGADRVAEVQQLPCPLWLGIDHLEKAVTAVLDAAGPADLHAVTMTGELAEIFPSRSEGVHRIIDELCRLLQPAPVLIYGGRSGFLPPREAQSRWPDVASANWHASAALIASRVDDALFVDIGSTTADVVPIRARRVAACGYSDAERLATGELIYTGVMRSSVMALAADAPFAGGRQRLMAENFSTAADIYRLTGELHPDDDQYPASDGRGKSPAECRARLARMLGRDACDAPQEAWNGLARYFRERQLGLLYEAACQVLSGAKLPGDAVVIGAGAGHFLIAELARRLGHPYRPFETLGPMDDGARRVARVCAPAVAVAVLAYESQ